MPRTKQVRKKSSILKKQKKSVALSRTESASSDSDKLDRLTKREYESKEKFLAEFNKFYKERADEYRQGYEHACAKIKEIIADNMPQSIKSMNINDVLTEDFAEENKNPNFIVPKVRPSRSRKPSEQIDFKRPKTPPTSKTRASSRKRSASASAATSSRTNQGMKTPLMSSRRMIPNSVITPKVSDTPKSWMRWPQHGEIAVSLSGSPLMLGPVATEDIPTVIVPLQDGRMVSIMPEADAPEDLPMIDKTTMQYLRTLKAHLAIIAPDTP